MRLNAEETAVEARRILGLAWPVMLTSLNWTLLHLIDVAVVGRYGTAELGSLAAARTLTYITIVMGLAGMSGVLIFAARADGARDLQRTGDYLRQGVLLGAMVGIACMIVLLLFAEPLLRAAGVPPPLARGGGTVVRVMALAYPAQFVQVGASYFLEGISRPRRVMTVNLIQLPINGVLAWAWVGGHLGLPAWGAAGAAAATSTVCLGGSVADACRRLDAAGGAGARRPRPLRPRLVAGARRATDAAALRLRAGDRGRAGAGAASRG